jgi:CheY-specific phosphatase CheX
MNLVEQDAFSTVVRDLTASTIEMFGSYGVAVTLTSAQGPLDGEERTSELDLELPAVVASIGYAGAKFRGALVLIASTPAIESWLRALGEPSGSVDVCDTLGEFSNMLLGRLKGHLLQRGLPILLSTPTTAVGKNLRVARSLGPSALLSFTGPGWTLEVRIGATFEADFAFEAPERREAVAEAGDMMLF